MEESKLGLYKPDGSIIDVKWNEVVYDCFIFDNMKIIVLKNEQFDEFIQVDKNLGNKQKQFMLGRVYSKDNIDYIFSLDSEDYEKALEYYLSLKEAFLGVADDKV